MNKKAKIEIVAIIIMIFIISCLYIYQYYYLDSDNDNSVGSENSYDDETDNEATDPKKVDNGTSNNISDWIVIPADTGQAPGCTEQSGVIGGCFGTHIIQSAKISKQISCLQIEINNCNDGIIDVTNNCEQDIMINGTLFPYIMNVPTNTSYDLVITKRDGRMHIINRANRTLDKSVHEELDLYHDFIISPYGQELSGTIGTDKFNFTFQSGELQKNVECLIITSGRMTGGNIFLVVSNNCQQDVVLEDFSFKIGIAAVENDYFGIDILRNKAGELVIDYSNGNFSNYTPVKDDLIEVDIKVGEDDVLLQYTKTGPAC